MGRQSSSSSQLSQGHGARHPKNQPNAGQGRARSQSRNASPSPSRLRPAIGAPKPSQPDTASKEDLAIAMDTLQSVEALQAKLEAMPEHLRAPILRQCSGLKGLLEGASS